MNLGAHSYPITVEEGALAQVGSCFSLRRRVLILTDSGVPAAYAQAVADACAEPHLVTLEPGEANKCPDTWLSVLRIMLKAGFDRGDALVAVGGGVIGDLGGFVAATYMRGIDFYNLPTTLLAMVDSSVGGKVAVDLDGYKNIVGTFYQPRAVLADPCVLQTLDARQYACGMAEIIKYGFIQDAGLLDALETDTPNWTAIIARCLTIKAALVAADERDTGARRLLNFGHTFGHAYEAAGGYAACTHGEAVAAGMAAMLRWQLRRGDGVQVAYDRLLALLERWELPCTMPFDTETVSRYLARDKKCEGDTLHAVLLRAIGDAYVEGVPLAALQEGLA